MITNYIESKHVVNLKENETLIDGLPVNLEKFPLSLRRVYEEISQWQKKPIEKRLRFYLDKPYYERLVPAFSEYLFDSRARKNEKLIGEVWEYIIPILFYSENSRVTAESFISFLNYYEKRFSFFHNKADKAELENVIGVITSLRENLKFSLRYGYLLITKNLKHYDETYVLGTYAKAMVNFYK